MEKNKIEKVYDQIHAPEDLKQRTFEKMKKTEPQEKKMNYNIIMSIAALFIITFAIGIANKAPVENVDIAVIPPAEKIEFSVEDEDLLHFKNVQELRDYFVNNNLTSDIMRKSSLAINGELNDAITMTESVATGTTQDFSKEESISDSNYYKTNTQVENVDEADIVKTDGEYIYYVTNGNTYIVKADNLNLESKLEFLKKDNEHYNPSELFIKDNKLIVIGNYMDYSSDEENTIKSRIWNPSINTTKAYIYDISDKSNPKCLREVDIDGDYDTSRLIGDTLYLISTKYVYYNEEMDDNDILPIYYDSAFSDEYKNLDCTHIIYKEKANDSIYKNIGAVDINGNTEISVETFLGYSSTIYCSEDNLYITSSSYNNGNTNILESTEISKFNISGGGLKYVCKTQIPGNVKDQFSLDEYKGNLRIATTVTVQDEPYKDTNEDEFETVIIGNTTTNNILYILDENLEKIGELTDFGITERIYSVRFIKDVAYIVTFQQIDPLYVMDLSDPENPTIKGELKIPGYSSYLHPYDENHIIGIGYNVKDNGYGGVTNETIKISMFDVSDLSNPKEVFNKTLGEKYSYSDVTYNHKLLMYDKERNLMGFPITMDNENGKTETSIVILEIDLDGEEFKINSKYKLDMGYYFRTYLEKVIYIEDTLYILCSNEILAFDINTSESLGTLKFNDTDELVYNDLKTDSFYVKEID